MNELGTQTATKANFPTRCQPRKQVCQSPACNDVHLCGYQLPVPPPTQIPSRKDICRHIACRAKITITRVAGDCNSQKASFALYWLISPSVPPPTQIPSRKDIFRHIACRAKITIPRVPGDCNSQKTSFALYWLNLLQIVGTRNP